jgi:anti-sigma regulatory factor (Ser/Thr protein kinase)
VNLSFRPVVEAIPEARRAIEDLADELSPRALEDARLLVSELVTNSIRHAGLRAGQRVLLRARVDGAIVRIEVENPGRGFELRPRSPDQERGSGWGLFLVGRLADRWGIEGGGSTRVWFEIDRSRTTAGAGRFGHGDTG